MTWRRSALTQLEERRKAILKELETVHQAIANIRASSDESSEWLQKLDKWHKELHELVDRFPDEE